MEIMEQNGYLNVIGVHKSYHLGRKPVPVLRGVDFSVGKGEWVAVLGASGSGKTTLLNIIGALERPDRGDVLFEGAPHSGMSESRASEFRRLKVGFIFQAYHMLPELSVLENVMLPGMISGRSASDLRRGALRLLEEVGLGHRTEHRPAELSGGEQQRAAIARSMINSPALILADEPTGNLDSETGAGILAIFRKMHDFNKTLVMVTHDKEVAAAAGRIVHVKDGLTG